MSNQAMLETFQTSVSFSNLWSPHKCNQSIDILPLFIRRMREGCMSSVFHLYYNLDLHFQRKHSWKDCPLITVRFTLGKQSANHSFESQRARWKKKLISNLCPYFLKWLFMNSHTYTSYLASNDPVLLVLPCQIQKLRGSAGPTPSYMVHIGHMWDTCRIFL